MTAKVEIIKKEVITHVEEPVVDLRLSLTDAWVILDMSRRIGGTPSTSARGTWDRVHDSIGDAFADHYGVDNRYTVTDILEGNQFSLSEQSSYITLYYNAVNVNDVVKSLEAQLEE